MLAEDAKRAQEATRDLAGTVPPSAPTPVEDAHTLAIAAEEAQAKAAAAKAEVEEAKLVVEKARKMMEEATRDAASSVQ